MSSSPQSPVLSTSAWLHASSEAADPHVDAVRAAVTQLFVAHRGEICRYLSQRGCLLTEAEEIAQDVFLRLYRARIAGTHVDAPRRWLFTVARNLAIDHLRRTREHRHLLERAPADAAEQVAEAGHQLLARRADFP